MSQSLSSPDWLKEGSDKLGTRVRRAILSEDGKTVMGYGDGTVVGWLPYHLSDFLSEYTQEPAPLWHIKYDSAELGEEDLEEVEVEDAAEAFQKDAWCNSDKAKEASEVLRKNTLARAEKETADEAPSQFPPTEHASGSHGSNSAPGTRGKGAKFEVGETVEARFSNGEWYQAMIAEALILKSTLYSCFSTGKRTSAETYGNVLRVLENGFFVVTGLDNRRARKDNNIFFLFSRCSKMAFLWSRGTTTTSASASRPPQTCARLARLMFKAYGALVCRLRREMWGRTASREMWGRTASRGPEEALVQATGVRLTRVEGAGAYIGCIPKKTHTHKYTYFSLFPLNRFVYIFVYG